MDRQQDAHLREGERLDDLRLDGLKIIQRADVFRFGTDSVLLADFARPRKGERAADLGAGSGVLCLLMAGHEPGASFDAVELQPDLAEMAGRSVALNGLGGHIRVHCADLRDAASLLGRGKYDLVVCNPPYHPAGTATASGGESQRLARQEGGCTVGEVARSAAALLRNGGRAALVYPAARALELMSALREAGLEPKRVRLVQERPGAVPKLILLDARKGAGSMLHWLPPLILRREDGSFSDERERIYRVKEGLQERQYD